MSETSQQTADPLSGAAETLGDAMAVPEDWPTRATEFVVGAVGSVRDKTSGPAISIARRIVYGLLAFFLALIAIVLLVVGVTRLFVVYIPLDVWAVYAISGAVWTIVGIVIWMFRPRGAGTPIPR